MSVRSNLGDLVLRGTEDVCMSVLPELVFCFPEGRLDFSVRNSRSGVKFAQ